MEVYPKTGVSLPPVYPPPNLALWMLLYASGLRVYEGFGEHRTEIRPTTRYIPVKVSRHIVMNDAERFYTRNYSFFYGFRRYY